MSATQSAGMILEACRVCMTSYAIFVNDQVPVSCLGSEPAEALEASIEV